MVTTHCDLVERRRLYDLGYNDQQIGKIQNVHRGSIRQWRLCRGLPVHRTSGGMEFTAARKVARTVYYALGWSDYHIAREQHVHHSAVSHWRRWHKMTANFEGTTEKYCPRPSIQDLVARVRSAIGRRLSPDIADEAVGAMMLALFDGTITLSEIERRAREFGNRALDKFASKFGPRSLDAEIGDSDGFTLLDTLVDEGSSDWLEEMGATVWR